jgi:hypothetical protein
MVNVTLYAWEQNITTFDQMFLFAARASDFWFSYFILIAVFMILVLGMGFYKTIRGIISALLITFLLSCFMLAMGAINPVVPIALGIITGMIAWWAYH